MTSKPSTCVAIEPDLIAAATGEAVALGGAAGGGAYRRLRVRAGTTTRTTARSRRWSAICARARRPRTPRMRAGGRSSSGWPICARGWSSYQVAPSPLGPILIAVTEQGVSLVEYLGSRRRRRLPPVPRGRRRGGGRRRRGGSLASRAARVPGGPPHAPRLVARSTLGAQRLPASGDARRRWRCRTARWRPTPAIARELGRPAAVRAVAQALRHNPAAHRGALPSHHRQHRQAGRLRREQDRPEGAAARLEGVPVNTRASRIERDAMYHYDPNPDHQYCLPTCGSILRRPLGQVRLFAHREQAAASGLEPCLDCRPDLHPLSR